jgi:hypothetical protein
MKNAHGRIFDRRKGLVGNVLVEERRRGEPAVARRRRLPASATKVEDYTPRRPRESPSAGFSLEKKSEVGFNQANS